MDGNANEMPYRTSAIARYHSKQNLLPDYGSVNGAVKMPKPGSGYGVGPRNTLDSSPDRVKAVRHNLSPEHRPSKKPRLGGPPLRLASTTPGSYPEDISDAASDHKSITDPGGSQGGSAKKGHLHFDMVLPEYQRTEETKRLRRRSNTTQGSAQHRQARDIRIDSDTDELGVDGEGTIQPQIRTHEYGLFTPRAQLHMTKGAINRRDSTGDGADDQILAVSERKKRLKTERKEVHVTRVRKTDNSPDPLHSDAFHTGAKTVRRPTPSSISSRGDIRPALPKSHPSQLGLAGFPIRAALGTKTYKYLSQASGGDQPSCLLVPDDNLQSLTATLTTISANYDTAQYFWMKIHRDQVHSFIYHPDSRIIKISRAMNMNEKLGTTLALECQDDKTTTSLIEWLRAGHKVLPKKVESVEKMKQIWDKFSSDISHYIEGGRVVERLPDKTHGPSTHLPTNATPPNPRTRMERDQIHEQSKVLEAPPTRLRTYAGRETRSSRLDESVSSVWQTGQTPPPVPALPRWSELKENQGWDKTWEMPLVYKRTTVDKDDIPKLDEGECLNDNIIGFGLRYLYEQQTPELKSRIFIHNSFFYEKLKMPGRGKINYEGVKTWTSKVDILSCDYIVVPVNEFHHWWVAIICHPGRLDSQTESAEKIVEDDEKLTAQPSSPADVEMVDAADSEPPKLALEPTTARLGSLPAEPTKDSNGVESSLPSGVQVDGEDCVIDLVNDHSGPSQELKKRVSGRKHDPASPRIITLDSLGGPHSAACTHLKKYIVAEFKDKRNKEITDVPTSFGMTATNIPKQDNFSDCGVYLLGYIREFVKDPDAFVNLILEKKECDWSWTASQLRVDFRDLIISRQKEYQEEQKEAKRQRGAQKRAKAIGSLPATPRTDGASTAAAGLGSLAQTAPPSAVPSAAVSATPSRKPSPIDAVVVPVLPEEPMKSSTPSPELDSTPTTHREGQASQLRKNESTSADDLSGRTHEAHDSGCNISDVGGSMAKNRTRTGSSSPKCSAKSESVEANEQLLGETLQAIVKAGSKSSSESANSEALSDQALLKMLPDSPPARCSLSPVRHPSTPKPHRSPRLASELIVDIPSASGKDISRREYVLYHGGGDKCNPVVVDDGRDTLPSANSSKKNPRSIHDAHDVPSAKKVERATRSRPIAPSDKEFSATLAGSPNVRPVEQTRVIRPTLETESSSKSPSQSSPSQTGSRSSRSLVKQHSAIDLTDDD